MGFQSYMNEVCSQLACNDTNEQRDYIVFEFSEEQVQNHHLYFFRCFSKSLSPYKALTFFGDHLRERLDTSV